MADDKQISIDEAVELIMRNTGKTRRQARQALVEYCRSGKLRATGINPETGEREIIPPEAWPAIN
jgi:hypothetical protein